MSLAVCHVFGRAVDFHGPCSAGVDHGRPDATSTSVGDDEQIVHDRDSGGCDGRPAPIDRGQSQCPLVVGASDELNPFPARITDERSRQCQESIVRWCCTVEVALGPYEGQQDRKVGLCHRRDSHDQMLASIGKSGRSTSTDGDCHTSPVKGPGVHALASQLDDLVMLVGTLSESDFGRATRCPGWSVAELVAHCEGILVRLVGENSEQVEGMAEIDRVGYYRYDPDGPREGEPPDKTFSEVIRERVIGEVGGRSASQLTSALQEAAEGALLGIATIPADRVIKRSGHPKMTFGEFVVSRNLEFGVHTMDIAHAVGRAETLDPAAAQIITGILDGLLGQPLPSELGWDSVEYTLSGTGRRSLTKEDRRRLRDLGAKFGSGSV